MDLRYMVAWRLYAALILSGHAKEMYTVSGEKNRAITVTANYVEVLDSISHAARRYEWGDEGLIGTLNDSIGCDVICPYVAFSIPAGILSDFPLQNPTAVQTGGTRMKIEGIADCVVLNQMLCVAQGYADIVLNYLHKLCKDTIYISVNQRNTIAHKSIKFPFYIPVEHVQIQSELDVNSRLLLRYAIMHNNFVGAVVYSSDGMTYSMTHKGIRVTLEDSGKTEAIFDWLSGGYTQRIKDSVCSAKTAITVELPEQLIDKLFTSKPSPLEGIDVLQVKGKSVGLRMSSSYICILQHTRTLIRSLLDSYSIQLRYYMYTDDGYVQCDAESATHWFLGSGSVRVFPDDFPYVRKAIDSGECSKVIHCLNCIDLSILPKLNVMLSIQDN